jgi:diaminopimelate epimerase
MTQLAFEKWEGLGNDFIVVEEALSEEDVRRICDRRRGVGADGVLLVGRPGADRLGSMIVFNADGSRPEMCGNGLRCVAAYLASGADGTFDIETDAGNRPCSVTRADGAWTVRVDMGRVTFEEELVVALDGASHSFAKASIGNPHAITFEAVSPALHERLGRAAERAVAGGTNVEFVCASPGRLDVIVWERGVGFTEACGTGACAVAAVACETGRAKTGSEIVVGLPGGDLRIVVEAGDTPGRTGTIWMSGPARRVFTGMWQHTVAVPGPASPLRRGG